MAEPITTSQQMTSDKDKLDKIFREAVKARAKDLAAAEEERRSKSGKTFRSLLDADGNLIQSPDTAKIVQQAYAEISNAGIGKVPTEKQVQKESAESAVISAEKTKEQVVGERKKYLMSTGVSDAEAEQQAAQEYRRDYQQPLAPTFGEFGTRKPSRIMPQPVPPIALQTEEPTIATAIKPQTFISSEVIPAEKERIAKGDFGGTAPDWKRVKETIIKNGAKEEEAVTILNAYKSAYNVKLNQLGNAQKAWEDTVSDVTSMDKVLKDKANYIKDPTVLSKGLNDPYYQAFIPQVVAGEGIAPLNETQREFVREITRQDREKELAKLRDEYKTKPVPAITEPSPYRGGLPVTRDRTPEEKEAWIQQELDRRAPKGIYFDEEKYKKTLKGEAPAKIGILETESPFGTTRETALGWLLRATQAPYNAVAATIFPAVGYGLVSSNVPGEPTFQEEMKGKAKAGRPEAYKESPVLLNIAENRGFGGEASKAAEMMFGDTSNDALTNAIKNVYVGGFYAADVLDPTLDLIAAGSKGVKGAAQYYKAAKAAKIPKAELGALKYGAKEAAKGTASVLPFVEFSPGDVRLEISAKFANELKNSDEIIKAAEAGQDMAKVLSNPKYNDSSFANKVKSEIKSGKTADEAIAIAKQGDNSINQVQDMSRAIDSMAQGKAMSGARQRDVARQIGALARDNSAVQAELKAVEAAKGGKATITDYVQALAQNPKNIDALKARLINDISIKNVYASTKDISAFNDLVQLTKNTWANKSEASKILNRAKQSEVGKLAQELKNNKTSLELVSTVTSDIEKIRGNILDPYTAAKVEPAVKLTSAQADVVVRNAQELAKYNAISSDAANSIIAYAKNENIITLLSLRKMIDGEVDIFAEVSQKAVRARDALLLDNSQQVERLLQPLETKSWGRDVATDYIARKKSGISSPLRTDVSPGQKDLLRTANQKAANMDTKLRSDMSKIKNNEQFQKLYTDSSFSKMTNQQALAHLVVGPIGTDNAGTIKKVIESAIMSSIYEGRAKEDIFETLVGANFFRDYSVFNKEGQQILNAIIDDIVAKVQKSPSELWKEMDNAIDAAQSISRDVSYLARPQSVDKITRIKEKALPAEIQIGAFYRAEAERIANETMLDLVSGPIKKTGVDISRNISEDAKYALDYIKTIDNNAVGNIVAHRIKENSQGNTILDMYNTKANEIADKFLPKNIADELKKTGFNEDFSNSIAEIVLEADDLAKTIAKANDLVQGVNPDRIAQATARFFEDPTIKKQAELLFGKDVYNSIEKEIGRGGNKISKNLRDLMSMKYDSNDWGTLEKFAKGTLDAIESVFYTTVLTLAPRFHGGNIFGAPAVLINSLGKTGLASLQEVPSAIRILATPESAANAIAFTDKAGRAYTIAEVRDAAKVLGGKSVYSSFQPNIVTEEAIRLAKDNPGKVDNIKEFASFLNSIAQKEDLTFRTAVLVKALKDGRNMDEAVKLARASMYDVGDITELERQSNRFLLFYNFNRNNIVATAKNLVSLEGLNRLYKYTKAKKSIEGALGNEQSETAYLPESAQERLVLDVFSKGGDAYAILGPPDSIISGLSFITKLAEGRYLETIGQMLKPGIKKTFDVSEMPEKTKVPPEHLWLLPQSVIDAIAGEKVVPELAAPGDSTAVNGYIYPLKSERAQKRYNDFISMMEYLGVSRLMTDIPRLFGAEGTPVDVAGAGKAAYAVAMMSPMKVLSKEKTSLYNTIAQTAEGRKMLKEVEKIQKEAAPMQAETYKDIVSKSEIRAGLEEKKTALSSLQSKEKQIMAYGQEAKAILKARIMSGKIGEDQIDAEAAKIEENISRLEGLQGSEFEQEIEKLRKKK